MLAKRITEVATSEVRTNEQHKPVDVNLGNLCDAHRAAHDDGPHSNSYSRNCHQVRSVGLQKSRHLAMALRRLNLYGAIAGLQCRFKGS